MGTGSALWWLAVPAVATLAAVAWTVWVSRPRPPADVDDTVEGYQRLRAAIEGTRGAGGGTADRPAGRRAAGRRRWGRRSGPA